MATNENMVWVRTIAMKGVLSDVSVYPNDGLDDAEGDALAAMEIHHRHVHPLCPCSGEYRRMAYVPDSRDFVCTCGDGVKDAECKYHYVVKIRRIRVMRGRQVPDDLADDANEGVGTLIGRPKECRLTYE